MHRVGHNHINIYGVYTIFWPGIHKIYGHIRIYGVYIRFWPTLTVYNASVRDEHDGLPLNTEVG